MLKLVIPALAMSLFAGAASAEAELDPNLDTDGDGTYSYPELTAVLPELAVEDYTALDLTGDGLLDMEEVALAMEGGIWPLEEGLSDG